VDANKLAHIARNNCQFMHMYINEPLGHGRPDRPIHRKQSYLPPIESFPAIFLLVNIIF
jgi:hypothetical protein